MTRRYDPDRRDRIIDAALDCIAQDGVAGTSHRKVAALTGVPLGSMTYHFAGMDALLIESFTRFATTISQAFEQRMQNAADTEAAIDAVVTLIHDDLQRSRREHVLTYELYTLAARRAEFRTIMEGWMRASRQALQRHFDPETACAIDAYIEGAALHIALDNAPQQPDQTRAALQALTGCTGKSLA